MKMSFLKAESGNNEYKMIHGKGKYICSQKEAAIYER